MSQTRSRGMRMSAVVLSLDRSPEALLDALIQYLGKAGLSNDSSSLPPLPKPICFLSTNKENRTLGNDSMHKFIAEEYGALDLIFLSRQEKSINSLVELFSKSALCEAEGEAHD